MKRAEIWTVAGGPDYTGKPRPAVIVEDDAFEGTASITVSPFTTHVLDATLIRLPFEPTKLNGLTVGRHILFDKITIVGNAKLQYLLGKLAWVGVIRAVSVQL